MSRRILIAALFLASTMGVAFAQKYDAGASDVEIKLGQTQPYSGPVSAAAATGLASIAYFEDLNKRGGINGRKVKLISLDDTYSPPKTVELTRQLVEGEEVLAVYGSIGTPTNAAVQKYLNAKKVPQLFIPSGANRFNNAKEFPWTIPLLPSFIAEGRSTARYVLSAVADPKIAILYQNDDFGRDFLIGFKSGLGDKAGKLIVSEQNYEVSAPTIQSQIIVAKASGANVFYFIGTAKFGAMQIRNRYELGWKPLSITCSTAAGLQNVLKPAGLQESEGLVSAAYLKDPADPRWENDADVKQYLDWARKYLPQKEPGTDNLIVGYAASYLMAYVLEQAGSTLTRGKLLEVASNLKQVKVPMFLPGITITTTPDDYTVMNKFQMQKFESGRWVPFGDLVSGE